MFDPVLLTYVNISNSPMNARKISATVTRIQMFIIIIIIIVIIIIIIIINFFLFFLFFFF